MSSGKMLTRMWVTAVTGAALSACGGGSDKTAVVTNTDTAMVAAPVTPAPMTDTAAAAAAAATAPTAATPAPTTAPAAAAKAGAAPKAAAGGGGDVAEGQKIFTGGAPCFTCHGPTGGGTALAPDLTDSQWIMFPSRPTLDQVAALIKTGVPQPKQHPAPMPPMGGANLTDSQVRSVAAYVLSLSK